MKSIPRKVPPPFPAGYEQCSHQTIARWTHDSYRYPPYQYSPQFIITNDDSWRLLSAEEKELLLGYGFEHTVPAWSASDIKANKTGYNDKRHSLLGDSFSIYSFVLFAYACAPQYLPKVSYKWLANRMGAAPGFRPHIRAQIPLQRTLQYGSENQIRVSELEGKQKLNRILLRRTNHTGSDVGIVTGEAINAKIFPRQSICSTWWHWKQLFAKRWKHKAHINVLELEAVLLGLKVQINKFRATDCRIFQLSDSYISMSVVSKGRSSSKQFQRVLNVIAAHLLGFGLQMVIAHVDSLENFADEGSRL